MKGGEPLTFSATGKEEVIRMKKDAKEKEKPRYKKSKEEKERDELFDYIDDKISNVRQALKLMYLSTKERDENFIHCQLRLLDGVRSVLFDLLFDGASPKEILSNLENKKASP